MNTQTVWKFTDYSNSDDRHLLMPSGAQIIHATAHSQRGWLVLTVWAIVDSDAQNEIRTFHLRGTGHALGSVGRHVATSIDGSFVWHIFEDAR